MENMSMAKIVHGRRTHTKTSREAVLEHVEAQLATLAEEIQQLRGQPLTPPSRVARGTRDVTRQAQEAAPEPPKSLRDRIREVLREHTLDYTELARALKAPVEEVTAEVKACAKEGLAANVGAEDFPMWTWRIGDDTSAKDLETMVRRLIMERPMTTRELTHATGARMTRVGGAIVAIQRSGDQVLDLNPRTRAGRWFIVLPDARDARLKPKQNPPSER